MHIYGNSKKNPGKKILAPIEKLRQYSFNMENTTMKWQNE